MSGGGWREEAREPVARAICEEIDNLPFGELGNPHRMQARGSYLADADLILTALAPVVAAEVARAEARGKVAALREAAEWFREADKALREPGGVPAPWLAAARRLDDMAAIEAEAGER